MSTESGKQSDGWELVFPGLLILPLVGLFLVSRLTVEVPANQFYVEGRCVLLDKRIAEDNEPGPKGAANSVYKPEFQIRYTVDGQVHEAWTYNGFQYLTAWRWPKERILEGFSVGEEYPCWYDADDPTQVVLVRGYGWLTYLVLTIFVALAFFTGKGVWRRLGPGRRAAKTESHAFGGALGSRVGHA
jgi:hypothetical protein